MLLIPLRVARSASGDPLPSFDLQTTLDGATYTIELHWNPRGSSWFCSVWDEALQTAYVLGKRVCANYPLGNWITGRSPPGALVFVDTAASVLGRIADPGLGDMGVRHQLYYATLAELALLG